jgi:CheY-like chemotaxis protein
VWASTVERVPLILLERSVLAWYKVDAYCPVARARRLALRLLLVEDDAGIGRFVRQGLVEAGYEIDWERDGARGLEKALSGIHDLLILDVLLPQMSGLELLAEARKAGISCPVLLLTA